MSKKNIDRAALQKAWTLQVGLSAAQLRTVAGGRWIDRTDKPPTATSGTGSGVCCYTC